MSDPNGLIPRAAQALLARSAHWARRVLSDFPPTDVRVLAVTRSCSHALAIATIAGDDALLVADARGWPARLRREDVACVVVGQDATWPYRPVLNRNGAIVACLRFQSGSASGSDFARVRASTATSITVEVGSTWRGGPALDHVGHKALLARVSRLGAWLATDAACRAGAAVSPEPVVQGARVLALAEEYSGAWKSLRHVDGDARVVSRVEDALRGIEGGSVDLILVQTCSIGSAEEEKVLLPALERAVANGVSVIAFCGCCDLVGAPSLVGFRSDLGDPYTRDEVCHALNLALLERKAWLHAAGLSSDHLIPPWEQSRSGA